MELGYDIRKPPPTVYGRTLEGLGVARQQRRTVIGSFEVTPAATLLIPHIMVDL